MGGSSCWNICFMYQNCSQGWESELLKTTNVIFDMQYFYNVLQTDSLICRTLAWIWRIEWNIEIHYGISSDYIDEYDDAHCI